MGLTGWHEDVGNVVPFPRRELSPADAPRRIVDGELVSVTRCAGLVHVFAEVPGRCQCGAELWTTGA